jgi:hypothetical protein
MENPQNQVRVNCTSIIVLYLTLGAVLLAVAVFTMLAVVTSAQGQVVIAKQY